MSRTAEYERQYPVMLQEEKDKLEKEVAVLRKQRKDEGLFLDVKKETKSLEALKVSMQKVIDDANLEANKILTDANAEADAIIARANDTVEIMKSVAEKNLKEVISFKESVTAAQTRLDNREANLDAREKMLDAYNNRVGLSLASLQEKAQAAIKALNEI